MNFLNGLEKHSRTVKAKTQAAVEDTEFVILDAHAMSSFCKAKPKKVRFHGASSCRGTVAPRANHALQVMQSSFASTLAC